jgi:hypothetical protein
MTEATLQAQLATALAPLVAGGSVLINDYRTPQITSQERAPWLILETADDVRMTTGEAWSTPLVEYVLFVSLLSYRRDRTDKEHLDAFQALRQSVMATLAGLGVTMYVASAETTGPIAPYYREDGNEDPDSLYQRIGITVTEYEV